MVVQVSVVLNRTVVVSDWQFDNLCDSHLQSQVSCITSVDKEYIIGRLSLSSDVVGFKD